MHECVVKILHAFVMEMKSESVNAPHGEVLTTSEIASDLCGENSCASENPSNWNLNGRWNGSDGDHAAESGRALHCAICCVSEGFLNRKCGDDHGTGSVSASHCVVCRASFGNWSENVSGVANESANSSDLAIYCARESLSNLGHRENGPVTESVSASHCGICCETEGSSNENLNSGRNGSDGGRVLQGVSASHEASRFPTENDSNANWNKSQGATEQMATRVMPFPPTRCDAKRLRCFAAQMARQNLRVSDDSKQWLAETNECRCTGSEYPAHH